MITYDIIVVREYFPSENDPSSSTWVYSQVEGIREFKLRPLVISPTPRVSKFVRKLSFIKPNWRTAPTNEIKKYNEIEVIRPVYTKIPNKIFFERNLSNLSNCIFNAGKNFGSKLIHAHFGNAGVACLNLRRISNRPLIVSFYGYDLGSDKERLLHHYKRLKDQAAFFLVLSNDMANDLYSLGFNPEKVFIHHLGVDIDRFKNKYINKSVFTFTSVARFEKKKGLFYLINAFKDFLIGKDSSKFELRIVGDGPEFNSLMKQARNVNSIKFINNFLDPDPRGVVLEEIQKSDVFVLPSITTNDGDKEGTPVVFLEAQACSKPCIGTFHAGIPEVIKNNVTGLLVEEKNIIQLKNAMETLYRNIELRLSMGVEARKLVESNFNKDKQKEELFQIYNKYLSN